MSCYSYLLLSPKLWHHNERILKLCWAGPELQPDRQSGILDLISGLTLLFHAEHVRRMSNCLLILFKEIILSTFLIFILEIKGCFFLFKKLYFFFLLKCIKFCFINKRIVYFYFLNIHGKKLNKYSRKWFPWLLASAKLENNVGIMLSINVQTMLFMALI